MISRSIKTVALLLLVLLGYAFSLMPLLLVRPHLQAQPFWGALAIWGVLALGSLPFVLSTVVRKIWFFSGRGEPIIQELLFSMLMGINDVSSPIVARKKRGSILLTWRCSEPVWCERMALEGIKKTYELRLRFHPETKTVIMIDRVRKINLDLCPIKVTGSWLRYPRMYCRLARPKSGLQSLDTPAADQYRFTPGEIKSPVFQTIIANGWNVQFDLF